MLVEITQNSPIITGMGHQFIHVEAYARQGSIQTVKDKVTGKPKTTRKLSAGDVAAEAERHPDACPHVENPVRPSLLYGVSPSQAVEAATAWAEQASDTKGRKLRKDGHCLLAGVVSMPDELAADWPAFRADTLDWLKQRYGDRLRSVVEHTDEAHPHVHFYVVPRPGEAFAEIHDGQKAARLVAAAGQAKGKQNAAYITAMRKFQDDFSAGPALKHGLTRLGPGRRRLTRAQWQAEKAQAKALALALPKTPPKGASIPVYRLPQGTSVLFVGEFFNADAVREAYREGAVIGYRSAAAAYEPIRKAIAARNEAEAEQVTKRAAKAQKAPQSEQSTFTASTSTLIGAKPSADVSGANTGPSSISTPARKPGKPTGPKLG